jgi:hypothetical protein
VQNEIEEIFLDYLKTQEIIFLVLVSNKQAEPQAHGIVVVHVTNWPMRIWEDNWNYLTGPIFLASEEQYKINTLSFEKSL